MTAVVRECPHCPFTVEDHGMTVAVDPVDDAWIFKATRHAWELDMLHHWRDAHPRQLELLALAVGVSKEALEAEFRQQVSEMVQRAFTTRRG